MKVLKVIHHKILSRIMNERLSGSGQLNPFLERKYEDISRKMATLDADAAR